MRTRFSRSPHRSLFAMPLVATLALVACGGAGELDDEGTSADAVKKRIKPQGTEGVVRITKPSWATAAFDQGLFFGGSTVKLGDSLSKPPDTYRLTLPASESSIEVRAGAAETFTPAGLRIRYANPIHSTWFASNQILVKGTSGYQLRAGGAEIALAAHAGRFDVTAGAFTWTGTLMAGALADIVVPTATLVLQFDTIDPSYPTVGENCLRLRALRNDIDRYPNYTATRWSESPALRELGAGPVYVPADVPVALNRGVAFSDQADVASYPMAAGTTTTITLNRLEVEDVVVPSATAPLRGTYSLELKSGGGSWTPYRCGSNAAFATHTGIDLPNGSYRVTTYANGPNGAIRSVEEVSFP